MDSMAKEEKRKKRDRKGEKKKTKERKGKERKGKERKGRKEGNQERRGPCNKLGGKIGNARFLFRIKHRQPVVTNI